jgi:hypothetical protein
MPADVSCVHGEFANPVPAASWWATTASTCAGSSVRAGKHGGFGEREHVRDAGLRCLLWRAAERTLHGPCTACRQWPAA